MRTRFGAPWGREVAWMTTLVAATVSIPALVQMSRGYPVISGLLLGILGVNACLCVRGYEIAPGELRVRRLFWNTLWPLDSGTRAIVRPQAMRGSWRTWGNGGVFAFSGHFSGSGLGRYRAFVTDPHRTVILETQRGIVVVSPDDPQQFVEAVATVNVSRCT